MVPEEESVCFAYVVEEGPCYFTTAHVIRLISYLHVGGNIVLHPLLIIWRNVGGVSTSNNMPAVQFFAFMDAVIETACSGERRGVRVSSFWFSILEETVLMTFKADWTWIDGSTWV